MGALTGVKQLVAREHVVQLFDSTAALIELSASFIDLGLGAGGAAVVIATAVHAQLLMRELERLGLDAVEAVSTARLTLLDAHETLARLLVDGMPDPSRFHEIIGPVVERAQDSSPHVPLRAFGEMVNVLWQEGRTSAALELERLWNELASERGFALLCAYRLDQSGSHPSIAEACRAHSHVIDPSGIVAMGNPAAPRDALAHVLEGRLQRLRVQRAKQGKDALAITRLIADCQKAEDALEMSRRRLAAFANVAEADDDASLEPAAIDWLAIARTFAERASARVAVLDRAGRVQLASQDFAAALGTQRGVLEGRLWTTACFASHQRPAAQRALDRAWSAPVHQQSLAALGADGSSIELTFDADTVGARREPALLITITAVRAAPLAAVALGADDFDYEVSTSVGQLGLLQRVVRVGAAPQLIEHGRRCYEVLHGRQTPCTDCPVLGPSAGTGDRTAVRPMEQVRGAFEIVRAEQLSPSAAHVSVRRMDKNTLSALREARIRDVAERFELSSRERDVLGALLGGLAFEDIAEQLGIGVRTVKFHQANILQKVGADSRSDLLRLFA